MPPMPKPPSLQVSDHPFGLFHQEVAGSPMSMVRLIWREFCPHPCGSASKSKHSQQRHPDQKADRCAHQSICSCLTLVIRPLSSPQIKHSPESSQRLVPPLYN